MRVSAKPHPGLKRDLVSLLQRSTALTFLRAAPTVIHPRPNREDRASGPVVPLAVPLAAGLEVALDKLGVALLLPLDMDGESAQAADPAEERAREGGQRRSPRTGRIRALGLHGAGVAALFVDDQRQAARERQPRRAAAVWIQPAGDGPEGRGRALEGRRRRRYRRLRRRLGRQRRGGPGEVDGDGVVGAGEDLGAQLARDAGEGRVGGRAGVGEPQVGGGEQEVVDAFAQLARDELESRRWPRRGRRGYDVGRRWRRRRPGADWGGHGDRSVVWWGKGGELTRLRALVKADGRRLCGR